MLLGVGGQVLRCRLLSRASLPASACQSGVWGVRVPIFAPRDRLEKNAADRKNYGESENVAKNVENKTIDFLSPPQK